MAESLAAIMCEENGFDEDYLQDLLEADDEFDEDRERDGGDDDGDDELVSIPLPTGAKLSSFGNDLICSFSRSVTSVASHLSIRSSLSAARGAALPQSQQQLSKRAESSTARKRMKKKKMKRQKKKRKMKSTTGASGACA